MLSWPAGMLYGEADALNSSYHISYNMLLNMLRVEDADPDFLVKSSFHQFQQEASAPALEVSHGFLLTTVEVPTNFVCA